MKKLSWLAGAVAAAALFAFATPANAQQPTTQEKDQKQAQQQQANPQQAQADTSCVPMAKEHAQHDTSKAAQQNPPAGNRKPCPANQNQSGVTSSTGTSTLGENVTKPTPDAKEPVTAKGDTLKKPAPQPSPN